MNRNTIILIMGIPGSGKTTFANRLSCEMAGIPVICTDIVKAAYRDKNRVVFSKVSHSAWQLVGECTDENVIKGYALFAHELFKYSYALAQEMLLTYNTVIIEGLGIDINTLNNVPENTIKVFITNSDRENGYRNKLKFRNNKQNNWEKNAYHLELIEKYILDTLNKGSKYIKCDVSETDKVILEIKDRISIFNKEAE